MSPRERTSVQVGSSSARHSGAPGHRTPRRRPSRAAADAQGARPSRHPRLAAWTNAALRRLPGTLASLAALVCLGCGLASLLGALLGASFDARVVYACALAPACAGALGQLLSRRGAAWAALACLVLVAAGALVLHADIAQQARDVMAALEGQGGRPDATYLLGCLSATLGTMASFLAYACRASWVMALAAVPLLVAAPLAGRTCPPACVALLACFFALALPRERVARRSGRPAASTALVVAACALGAAVGVALATTCTDALSAPARALEASVSQAFGGLASHKGKPVSGGAAQGSQAGDASDAGAAASRATDAAAGAQSTSSAGDELAGAAASSASTDARAERSDVATSGRIRRDALGAQQEEAHEVTLESEPAGAVYLREFTGLDYDAAEGTWGAATEQQMDDPDAFLDAGEQAHARIAELVAENPQADAASAEAYVLQLLAENVTYTTQMAPIPAGADIPEYVLFEGHEGYCQHFATIATLMLRAYGVPARYVAGYAAPASAFSQGEDGLWHAWLDGRSAHAWVEVWDADASAWQVVETTPADTPSAPSVDYGTQGASSADADGQEPTAQEEQTGATDVQPSPASSAGLGHTDEQPANPGASAQADATSTSPASATSDGGATSAGAAGPSGVSGSASSAAGEGSGMGSAGTASSAGAESSGTAAGDGSQALGLVRRLLLIAGMCVAVLAAAVAAAVILVRRALAARRGHILAAREQATAAQLLADACAALRYAGVPVSDDAGSAEFARAFAHASGVDDPEAAHLAHEALRSAFGPDGVRAHPADERCRAVYRAACEHARARLAGARAWAFANIHAWL